jgi:integrase
VAPAGAPAPGGRRGRRPATTGASAACDPRPDAAEIARRTATQRRRTGLKIYPRTRATGATYFYGDFRRFADVGGKLEALTPPGAREATQDFAEAAALYVAREQAYRDARVAKVRRQAGGDDPIPGDAAPEAVRLGPFLAEHLEWKAARPEVRTGTIVRDQKAARVLITRLGNRPIREITAKVLEEFVKTRLAEPGSRRGSLTSPRTVRAELHTLSNAFRRAVANDLVAKNPCAKLMAKPAVPDDEAVFLTDAEAARVLAAAREEDAATAALLAEREGERVGAFGLAPAPDFSPLRRAAEAAATKRAAWAARADDAPREPSPDDQVPFAHAITATYLYTGGRASEVLGLLAQDVDFDRRRVRFRHNRWRRLKREYHVRWVPLWPALEAVLREHVAATGVSGEDLLFPSSTTGGMLDRFGKPLDRIVRRAGITGKRVTPKALRHTYATALLQTLVAVDGGEWAARSSFDVAKKLGHKNSTLVDEVYGHAVEDPVYRRELRYGSGSEGAGAGDSGLAPTNARADDAQVGA